MGGEVLADHGFVDLGGDADLVGVAFPQAGQDVIHVLADGFGRDAVQGVIGHLLFAAPVRFANRAFHAAGHPVGIHDHPAFGIAGSAADGLDKRGFRAKKAFLVRVQNGHQSAFRDVQTFAQKVDADQHVKRTKPKITQDFNAFDGVDVRVHVADADALFVEIFGQVFGHAFGQHRHEDAQPARGDTADFVQQVIHLHLHRSDFYLWVDQAGGTDNLFYEHAAGLFQLPRGGGGGNEDGLRAHRIPFLELQGAVVHAAWQPEPVLGEGELAAEVALVHAADLGDGNVGFVGENNGIVGDEFEQRRRRFARRAAGEVAGIVLDPGARACRLQHLKIKGAALFQTLRL